jgi:hypothetical protein
MAKHRAPVVKRQRVRRTLRVLGSLPFRGLVLVGRVMLAGPRALAAAARGAAWLARGLVTGTVGLAWLAVTSALILVASLAGKYGAELRNMIVKHLLEPFGAKATAHTKRSSVPSKGKRKCKGRKCKGKGKGKAKSRHTNPSTLARDVDPDPALWPHVDNAWGGTRDPLVVEDDLDDSITMRAIKGLR